MRRISLATTASVLVIGCGSGKTATNPAPAGAAAPAAMPPGATLEIASTMGSVRNVDKNSACPMVLHYEGSLLVTGYTGKVTYRWERSTGKTSTEHSVNATAATGNDVAPLQVDADEWILAKGDKGGKFTDRIHVLTPVDKLGQENALQAACK